MTLHSLIGVLALLTLGSGVVFAYLSAAQAADRLHADKRKSERAADAPRASPQGTKPMDP